MRVQLKNILPNPFRNLEDFPVLQHKVDELKKSINTTGFWDNVVVREAGDKVEIAYGHNRVEALRQLYPSTHEVDLIVRPLTNEVMLQMMAADNNEAYASTVLTLIENVKQTVSAYGAGEIKLPAPHPKTKQEYIRYAPSYAPGLSRSTGTHPYTIDSIATFLVLTKPNGSYQDKVAYALGALHLIELGYLTMGVLRGIKDLTVEKLGKCVRDAQDRYEKVQQNEKLNAAKAEREGEQLKERLARIEAAREQANAVLIKKAHEIAEAKKAEDIELEKKLKADRDERARKEEATEKERKKAMEAINARVALRNAEIERQRKEKNADLKAVIKQVFTGDVIPKSASVEIREVSIHQVMKRLDDYGALRFDLKALAGNKKLGEKGRAKIHDLLVTRIKELSDLVVKFKSRGSRHAR